MGLDQKPEKLVVQGKIADSKKLSQKVLTKLGSITIVVNARLRAEVHDKRTEPRKKNSSKVINQTLVNKKLKQF